MPTFVQLQDRTATWLNRTDLTVSIPYFIEIAQRDLERENWDHMKKRQTVTSSEAYITLPDRLKEMRWMKTLISGRYRSLEHVKADVALELYPYPSSAKGPPEMFALLEEQNEFLIRPTPDTSYTYDIGFYQYTVQMSGPSDTNWWSLNAWELLLYGALIQAAPYLINDPRMETWRDEYKKAMSKLLLSEKRGNVGSGPLVIRANMPSQLRSTSDFDFLAGE